MLNKEKKVEPTSKSGNDAKPIVSRSFLADIRQAVADYIATEGCSCCRDIDGHKDAMERLGKMIRMKKYSDGSGYDYSLYRSKK